MVKGYLARGESVNGRLMAHLGQRSALMMKIRSARGILNDGPAQGANQLNGMSCPRAHQRLWGRVRVGSIYLTIGGGYRCLCVPARSNSDRRWLRFYTRNHLPANRHCRGPAIPKTSPPATHMSNI